MNVQQQASSRVRERPILISGPPRGGTTWVGKVLSYSNQVAYIHEPFNPAWNTKYRPGLSTIQWPHSYMHIDKNNEGSYFEALHDVIELRYRPLRKLRYIRTVKDTARLIRDWMQFAVYRVQNRRVLVKDPIAIFSVEWLASTFGMSVILLTRHPLAFVGSMKRLNWRTNFRDLACQESLLNVGLFPYRDKIRYLAMHSHDIIDNATLLWQVIHYALLQYRERHPDWLMVAHEDLARAPEANFRNMFDYAQLSFSSSVQEYIRRTTASENPTVLPTARRHSIHRNSRETLTTWHSRLSPGEIERVNLQTSELVAEIQENIGSIREGMVARDVA